MVATARSRTGPVATRASRRAATAAAAAASSLLLAALLLAGLPLPSAAAGDHSPISSRKTNTSPATTLWTNSSSTAADDADLEQQLLLLEQQQQEALPAAPPPTLGRRTAVLDSEGQFYYGNGTAAPLKLTSAAFRRAARLGLLLRPSDDPMDSARRQEATAMGVYGASPVKLQYPGEPSFNGITGPLGSIDYDDGNGAECFRYLPGCLACDKFYTVAPGIGALFQYRCLACLQPEYQLNGIKCECGPGFGIPTTLGLSAGPKPSRGATKGYGGQATMYTTCQRCPGNFFLDPAYSSSGATMGPACIRCPRNTKSNPDQSGCECSPGAAPIQRPGIQEVTGLSLAPPRCVMCPAGTYVPSPNRGNYGCLPCLEGSTTPPGRFGMISTRLNGNGKDACNWCLPGYAGNPEGWKPPDTTRTLELAGQICILCSDEGDVQTTTRLRTASICEEPTFGEVAGGGDIEKDEMEGGAAGNSTAPPPITTRRRPGM